MQMLTQIVTTNFRLEIVSSGMIMMAQRHQQLKIFGNDSADRKISQMAVLWRPRMSEVKTNKISSVSTNGDITLDPDGTGDVVVASGHNFGIGTTKNSCVA